MKKLSKFTLAAVVGLAGCSLLSGPSNKQIEDLARQGMVKNLGGGNANQRAAVLAAAQTAIISKKGLCNTVAEKDVYVCMVDVTAKLPGAAQEGTQTFIVKAKKAADGSWINVD